MSQSYVTPDLKEAGFEFLMDWLDDQPLWLRNRSVRSHIPYGPAIAALRQRPHQGGPALTASFLRLKSTRATLVEGRTRDDACLPKPKPTWRSPEPLQPDRAAPEVPISPVGSSVRRRQTRWSKPSTE